MKGHVIVRGKIRLPASSPRGTRGCYLKLLSRVDADAQHGFGFEGSILRPGQLADRAQLRPALNYPETPVLLEMSVTEASGPRGRRRRESVYTLWRWTEEAGEWSKLAMAIASAWEWAIELRPLAIRALAEARGAGLAVITRKSDIDLPAIAGKISEFIDCEFKILTAHERLRVLAVLHDEIATRICA